MSPRAESSRAPSSRAPVPYAHHSPRRPQGQPKSSRQQFSACGACRMRRVRCDLKDLQAASPEANHSACSNCQERGLKCVDEFAEVKAVKLLRRGRRLQQVEAVYGKAAKDADPRFAQLPPHSVIPKLQPEFFSSNFFRRLHVQRPIIEPTEFVSRYYDAQKGRADVLGPTGQLICMVLMTWAASFGVNEYGHEDTHNGPAAIRQRRDRTNEMVTEILSCIDAQAILRKPSWDGVRVLLLLLPLTEGVQSPLDRLTMYEAAVNQTYVLCSLASVSSVESGQGPYIDSLVRMLIFDYAYVHESMTTGLRGGRLLLTDDDLDAFQATLHHVNHPHPHTPTSAQAATSYTFIYTFAGPPIRVARTCRRVHLVLTGPKARQRDDLDEEGLRQCWADLESSWDDFEQLRQVETSGILTPDDVDRFVSGWQISIFECHNIIREALRQRLAFASGRDRSSAMTLAASTLSAQIAPLHAIADTKCHDYARHVLLIVSHHLGSPFFAFDASLVRDGVFYAALLLAGGGDSSSLTRAPSHPQAEMEQLQTCLQALREMRWAFSKSEEREQTLKMTWSNHMADMHTQAGTSFHAPSSSGFDPTAHEQVGQVGVMAAQGAPYEQNAYALRSLGTGAGTGGTGMPALTLQMGDSRPNTATTDGSGAWPPMSATSSAPSHFAAEGHLPLISHSTSVSPLTGSPPFRFISASSVALARLHDSDLGLFDGGDGDKQGGHATADAEQATMMPVYAQQTYVQGRGAVNEGSGFPGSGCDISPFSFAPPGIPSGRRASVDHLAHVSHSSFRPQSSSSLSDTAALLDPVSMLFPPQARRTSASGSGSGSGSTRTLTAHRSHDAFTPHSSSFATSYSTHTDSYLGA